MNITLSENTPDQSKSQLQKQFDKLWKEVKKQQTTNEQLKVELEELYSIYQKDILPVEKQAETPYTQLTQRLIEFFSRKSLAQWQRHELSQWIFECIERIEPLNPEKSQELMSEYHQTLANFFDVGVEEIENEAREFEDPLSELFEEFPDIEDMMNDSFEKESTDEFQEDMFEFSEEEGDADQSDTFFFQNEGRAPAEGKLLSDKWLRTVFRRTANALHPDKEMDVEVRKEKEALMSQLLVARDEKDVFTLLNFYMLHVGDDDLCITEETMEALCRQLQEQKFLLEVERAQILFENPMYGVLHEKLYSKNKKTRDKKIAQHIKQVKASSEELSEFSTSLKNLKILKVHLGDRYDERHMQYFEESPFDFFDHR
tara:strand:- start:9741 stop:10856 length:1116 start_codon:yes stop_codon:yes gene_type:complete